jgi:hypothetical protein
MPLNGPIRLDSNTRLVAIAFVLDPQLGTILTANGSVDFLQVVGLTEDELDAIQCWNAVSFIELAATRNPLHIIDLERCSFLEDVDFAEQVRSRTKIEGASSTGLYTKQASFKKSRWSGGCTVYIGALYVESMLSRLCGRIPYGRDFVLYGTSASIKFIPSDINRWRIEEQSLVLEITTDAILELKRSLAPKAGTYEVPGHPRLSIQVEKSEIKDSDGKVTDVVG